jgi:V/A-type H+-transporting ATPase subunit I
MGYVIAAAGSSSALFGTFFQGAFFGKSLHDWGWPLTLALEPLRWTPGEDAAGAGANVLRYLAIALVAGVVLISTGVILNVINCVRRGDLAGGLLGRFGVVGIVFYWSALALAVKLAVAGPGGADLWLAMGLIVPLVLLALHEPIYALLTRRKKLWDGSPAIGLLEGVVEAFETAMTYLANTFSFLRVAAFALSHGALCLTIFVIQGMVKGPAAILWYSIVFVLGTALIIGLEGLIVAIQVCRLEYYEFFSKFFRAEGTRFKPFRLD